MTSQETGQTAETGLMARGKAFYAEHHHLLKYLFIGGMASAIDVVLFFIIYNFVSPGNELLAHSVSVPTAVVFSFVVNARHNFKTNDHALVRFISFCIVCIIGYAAGYAVILGVQGLFENEDLGGNVGKIASLPVVFIIQYILNSKITFRQSATPTA